ncbi:sodium channel protein type 4 subunit alpha isoform X1 [Hydra vulgaris]|uniref:sodium channel protein type 4 subunit alpha isoform X1 n=2 Tax=Hydra vulgaris TaxID=6087 RepID=UPI001F5E60EF|nr:sodium channel protein type 4 subunit alpha isoform X1 [Hydra vulgaris]
MDPALWNEKYQETNTRSPVELLENVENKNSYFENVMKKTDHDEEKVESLKGISDEEESINEIDDGYIRVPPCMLGRPLKDFDCENDNNFVVVNKKLGKQMVFRFSKDKSLFLFGAESLIRKVAIHIFTHEYFDNFILVTILVNCIFMALNDPPKIADYVFAVIYTSEMIIKILAKGFILHKYSYLRSFWNWLDFTVVLLGYVTMSPNIGRLDSIKTFRILRILRTLSSIKGLKTMVETLTKSMVLVKDVLILVFFYIALFALIGLQLFRGNFRSRCIKNPNDTSIISTNKWKKIPGNMMSHICGNVSTSWYCEEGWTCVPNAAENPYRYINYDNFLYAMLTSLQLFSLDNLDIVLNSVIESRGQFYMFYFMVCIFLGPFYLLNLVLAVVTSAYESELNPDKDAELEKLTTKRRSNSVYSFQGDCFVEFLSGPSPLEEVDGELQYTVENPPPIKRKKKKKSIVHPPELNDNITFYKKMQYVLYKIVSNSFYEWFIFACIILSTVFMSAEHIGMDATLASITSTSDFVFTGIFIIEMTMKLFALSLRGYLSSKWNLLDGLLVVISVVNILLVFFTNIPKGTLKMLKVFRLLRILKVTQSWKGMGQLLATISNSLSALVYAAIILGLVIYIFSVIGMQLFRKYYTVQNFSAGEIPRFNFTDFGNSLMMIFRIFCGKWIEPTWDLISLTSPASMLFIFFVFVTGRWIVLNLFLALLLNAFSAYAMKKTASESNENENKPKSFKISRFIEWVKGYREKSFKSDFVIKKASSAPQIMHMEMQRGEVPVFDGYGNRSYSSKKTYFKDLVDQSNGSGRNKVNSLSTYSESIVVGNSTSHSNSNKSFNKRGHSSSSVQVEMKREKTYVDDCLCDICYQWNCFYSSYLNSTMRRSWHNARYLFQQLIEYKYFEGVVLFLIGFSSITLVFEDIYLSERPMLQKFILYCNYFFAIVFTLEFLIKVFAMGLVKYFTNLWNLLDVFIVVISLTSLLGGNKKLKALRSLRGLRPLRAIARFKGMKIVVNALLASIPSIANVLFICLIFWLIFSIIGFNLFGGKFSYCANATNQVVRLSKSFGIKTKAQCLNNSSFNWVQKTINFDSSINGFLALFQTATLEGWFDVMADAQDATGVDEQPQYRYSYANQLFFVAFVILGRFFFLNLFIGVIIDNFNRLKQQYEDGIGVFLTPGQRNWINTLKSASLRKPTYRLSRPQEKWCAALFDFVRKRYFEFFIMGVIFLNMITMMIEHHDQSNQVASALTYLNYLFTAVFAFECVALLVCMRFNYFRSRMNIFDLLVVLVSIIGIVLDVYNLDIGVSPGLFRVVRVFRISRLLRFFEGAKGVRKMMFTVIKSGPSLSNVGTLIFLITFIYSVIAMNLFGRLKHQGPITQVTNFETFASSFCLLFRTMTTAGWNDVLDAAMIQPPRCNASLKTDTSVTSGDCGNTIVAIIFFVSYVFFIVLILLNMYIAVILENFNQAQSQEEAGLTEEDILAYYTTWEDFDPKATQFIKYSKLPDFLHALEGPLRIPKPNYWFLEQSDIPIRDRQRCHCLDVMISLIRRALGEASCEESDGVKIVMKKVEERYKKVFPLWAKEVIVETIKHRLKTENTAARRIQRVFRRHLLMDNIQAITTSKNIGVRSREKTLWKIERLITVLWKAKFEYQKFIKECNEEVETEREDDNTTRV